jgi:ParB family chromosome partitioning protein
MQIDHIPLDRLSVSPANMRSGKKPPDITDILPSVIKRGVISPLFVRPNCNPGHFEIVAGKRRYFASLEAARQGKDDDRSLAISPWVKATMPRRWKCR